MIYKRLRTIDVKNGSVVSFCRLYIIAIQTVRSTVAGEKLHD